MVRRLRDHRPRGWPPSVGPAGSNWILPSARAPRRAFVVPMPSTCKLALSGGANMGISGNTSRPVRYAKRWKRWIGYYLVGFQEYGTRPVQKHGTPESPSPYVTRWGCDPGRGRRPWDGCRAGTWGDATPFLHGWAGVGGNGKAYEPLRARWRGRAISAYPPGRRFLRGHGGGRDHPCVAGPFRAGAGRLGLSRVR